LFKAIIYYEIKQHKTTQNEKGSFPMNRTEHDELDFEVEIVDLDDPTANPPSGPFTPRRFRLTSRQRKLSLWLTGLLFLVTIGVLLGSISDIRGLLASMWSEPAPTGTAVPENLFFYVQENPSWGQFTIDGHPLTRLPRIARDQPLSFSPGTHQIIWQAAPFNARTCLFTVVNILTFSSPCLKQQDINSQVANKPAKLALPLSMPVMLFTFFASLNDLPPGQRTSLVQQTQTLFSLPNSSEQVYPGEAYAVSEQAAEANPSLCQPVKGFALCFARANQPLVASLSAQLDTSTALDDPCVAAGLCGTIGQDCRQFCNPFSGSEGVSPGWDIGAVIHLLWTYKTLSGQVIASNQPDSAIRGSAAGYVPVTLHITRDRQGWHIALLPGPESTLNDPSCMGIERDISTLYTAISNGSAGFAMQEAGPPQTQIAEGCLEVFELQSFLPQPFPNATNTPLPEPSSTPVSHEPAYFLFRFGVILAVNPMAHSLLPKLPMADSYEQNLAQHLLASMQSP
jgi:hypothetical protein